MATREIFKFSYHIFNRINNATCSPALNLIKTRLSNPFGWTSGRLCSSQVQKSLMEFFDDEANWSKNEVRVGRSWRKDELRIKSNEDLHKLWYVLLKERNMLLTMEEECNRNYELFPSPERLYKVKESMVNLEDVVRERNKAYFMLETGTTGERPGKVVVNQLGLNFFYKAKEHWIKKEKNLGWFAKHKFWYRRKECEKFLRYYREKLYLTKRKARIRDRNHVIGLLKRFPDLDVDYIKDLYPSVDIEKAKQNRKSDGHYVR